MEVIFFVLVMLQLPAHSDTTIQGTCTYNLLLLFGHWSLRPSPCTVRRWPGELEIFKKKTYMHMYPTLLQWY